ncbi:MauE/DoxX family redox-associated membrane protein [Gillisia limnaea]|uniref:Methylamine utilisation protein MauE domain-containing protein n=1 Tax=Gillisia limnaea (strain DSM 15749 / LMG 21470 / R-8282) TaxID=865937 RepID=H2BXW3_GILLR|nr:MauE/DoxX family redox-associated membrane protein [Gillisia limnaea]EHQ02126.1 hypothetical protein Gilli_1472 [Gillisia limnaea DSM 15749]
MMALKFRTTEKNLMVEIISYLFIVLFVYAAVSKLLDFEQFRVQVGQSPLINTLGDYVAWGVPVVEISISLLFFFSKLRLIGLWASFFLMSIFSAYIILVLNFADAIPCSCGGVIASLSWKEHLVFNIGWLLLALLGIFLSHKTKEPKNIDTRPFLIQKMK